MLNRVIFRGAYRFEWRGRRWSEIDEPSFLEWVLRRDFDEDTLFTARHYLDRMMEAVNG